VENILKDTCMLQAQQQKAVGFISSRSVENNRLSGLVSRMNLCENRVLQQNSGVAEIKK
jgi:hypothetical protein